MKTILAVCLLVACTYSGAQDLKLILPIGHQLGCHAAFFSKDGKKIITASDDKTVKIWDAASGLLLANYEQPREVEQAEFSPDGQKIIVQVRTNVSNGNGNLLVLNTYTGRLLFSLSGFAPQFSPDGNYIAATVERLVKIWNAKTGSFISQFLADEKYAHRLQFSPDKEKIVTVSSDATAKLWNTSTGELLTTLRGHENKVNSAQFSPDGTKIVTSSDDKSVRIWDANSGAALNKINEFPGPVSIAKYSSDGKKLLIGSAYNSTSPVGNLQVFETAGSNRVTDLKVGYLNDANFNPEGEKIVIASSYVNGSFIIDIKTGAKQEIFRGHNYNVSDAYFLGNGNKMAIAVGGNTAQVWDVENGIPATGIIQSASNSSGCEPKFSKNGSRYAVFMWDKVLIKDVSTDKEIASLPIPDFKDSAGRVAHSTKILSITDDGKKLATLSHNGSLLRVWNTDNGNVLLELKGAKSHLTWEFSADGKRALTVNSDKSIDIRNAENDSLLVHINAEYNRTSPGNNGVYDVKFLNNDVVAGFGPGSLKMWNANTGQSLASISGSGFMRAANLSPDGKKIIVAGQDGPAKIYDFVSLKLMQQLNGQYGLLMAASFSPDGKRILTSSYDGTSTVWEAGSGKPLYNFFTIDETDYISLVPGGFYRCSPNAAKLLHYVTKDLKTISFDQLDIKFNRPDKVLEAAGNKDTALVRSYRNAFYKRIKKLGIDTMAFRDGYSVPETLITNSKEIAYEQKSDKLALLIKAEDNTYKLDRFNLFINDVPVYGSKGVSLRGKNKNNFDTTITVVLSQGENRIEVSVLNVNGTESYRSPLFIKYMPATPVNITTFFAGIGIDRFSDSGHNLHYCEKDIRDIAAKLKEKYGKALVIIDTLFNESVTIENVKAIKQKLVQAREDDIVIIAYSGHGLLSRTHDYYLSTFSVNFDKPEFNGLAYEEMESLVDGIKSRKKLMLIDACHSGEIDKENMQENNRLTNVDAVPDKSVTSRLKGGVVQNYQANGIGLKNSFELMQELFVNVSKGTGTTVVAAASGKKFAQESNRLRNGVFTYSLIEVLGTKKSTRVADLKKYVNKRVFDLTKGLQQPIIRNEIQAVNWVLW